MTKSIVLAGAILLATACGNIGSGEPTEAGPGDLRATVSAAQSGGDTTLALSPDRLTFGDTSWATHDVTVEIATDDYVQTFSLYDHYVVEDGSLNPSPGSTATEHVLSDTGPVGTSFEVGLSALPIGATTTILTLGVHLDVKPEYADVIEARDTVQELGLKYEVFVSESTLDLFCAEAISILSDENTAITDRLLASARDTVDRSTFERYEAAAQRYDQRAADDMIWDPTELFDLTEAVCNTELPDRWMSMA